MAKSPMTRVTAEGVAALMLGTGLFVRDLEAIAIGLLLIVAYGLLRFRHGLIGRIALAALFVDIIGWMAPAAWSNASHGDAVSTYLVPLLLFALSLAGLVNVAGASARVSSVATVGLIVVSFVAATIAAGNAERIPPISASVRPISARGAKFSTNTLRATRDANGTIAVVFHNKDLFWHTVTVDKLELSVRAPANATRVDRVQAEPGTYEFYCAIVGHKAAGMKGTLVVS